MLDHFDLDAYLRAKAHEQARRRRLLEHTHWDTLAGELFLESLVYAAQRPEMLKAFLDQLLTEGELGRIADRLRAAQNLFVGAPYRAAAQIAGVSLTSVRAIAKRLRHRTTGVYEVLSDVHARRRLEGREQEDKEAAWRTRS